jgi:hypothetical protein
VSIRLLNSASLALGLSLATGLLSVGCRSRPTAASDKEAATAEKAASSASVAPPLDPAPREQIESALNPNKEAPYSGPIGSIRGVVHVSGDRSPELADIKQKIPAGRCDDARAFYGTLFREGTGRELGDVLVAVTGYKGYLPSKAVAKRVVARGCAYESRTIAMVFGQRIEVFNKGGETFIPSLRGAQQAALVVAMPGGDPVTLFPTQVGEYELTDETHEYAKAEVFVLKFPTAAVTGLDGKYEITELPAGDMDISAYLPATRGTVTQHVTIVAGETTTVDLTIPFDAKRVPPPPP